MWEYDSAKTYWISIYYAVMMFGNNEMGPLTSTELCIAAIIMLGGLLINAKILGEMSVLLYLISRKD
jgi:hypothetical protein